MFTKIHRNKKTKKTRMYEIKRTRVNKTNQQLNEQTIYFEKERRRGHNDKQRFKKNGRVTNEIRLRTGFPFYSLFCFQTYMQTYTIAIYLYINVLKDMTQKIQTYLFVGFHTFKHILK